MAASVTLNGLYYEVHGEGIPLMLGYPISASPNAGSPERATLDGYLQRLTDRYRVVVMDFPSGGKSTPYLTSEFTAERACNDLLAVADDVGFTSFAWWGFSWGGLIGLHLASRSSRVSTLICGGWPPLGGPYAEMLLAIRQRESNRPPGTAGVPQFITFYESVQGWPEAQLVPRIACPKMTFVGSIDEVEIGGVKLPLAALIRNRRQDLELLGWVVEEIPDRDHSIYTDPGAVVPIVRPFLDRVTLTNPSHI